MTKMAYRADADLFFAGNRHYIQGTLIVDRFLATIGLIEDFSDNPDVEIVDLTMHKEMREYDGIVEVVMGDESSCCRDAPLAAQMTALVDGLPATFFLYENPSKEVTRRDPHSDEQRFVRSLLQTAAFEGSCTLVNLDNSTDLIRGIVEANKQIHMRSLDGNNPNIRWVYLGSFRLPSDVRVEPEIQASFRLMSANSFKGVRYTRVRFILRVGATDHTGEIRYTYNSPSS